MESNLSKKNDVESNVNQYVTGSLGPLSGPESLELNFEGFVSLLKASDSTAQWNETKWSAVVRWVMHTKSRDVHLPKFLDILDIQDFSFLATTVWEDLLVQKSKEAQILVASSLFSDLEKLEENISADNCFQLMDANNAHGDVNKDDVGKTLIMFMSHHFEEIVEKVEFLKLNESNLTTLVKSHDAKTSVKMRIEAIFKWVKYAKEREISFPQLFRLLNLKALDVAYIRDVLMTEPLVMNSQECLLKLCLPDGGQYPCFAIFDQELPELTVLNLEDGKSHSIRIPYGDEATFRGIVEIDGEVYLVTENRILKIQGDGKTITLRETGTRLLFGSVTVAFQKKIYVVQPNDGPGNFGNHMVCFDPVDSSFVEYFPECGLGYGFSAAATEDSIYALGGQNTTDQAKRFDPRTRTWTKIAAIKTEILATAASFAGNIYVIGDKGLDGDCNAVKRYCPESNSWTEISHMNASRLNFSACVFNDRLYAIAENFMDERENGYTVNTIEVYDRELDRWMTIGKFLVTDISFACIWPHGPFKPDLTLEQLCNDVEQTCHKVQRHHAIQLKRLIGPDGGSIELDAVRCKIDFPLRAVKEEKEFIIIVNEQNDDKDILSITPLLTFFEPTIKFDQPVSIALRTCMSADANTEIPVTLFQNSNEFRPLSEWKKTDLPCLSEKNEINFPISSFSFSYQYTKIGTRVFQGNIHLFNDVGVQEETGRVCAVFAKFKICSDILKWILERRNFKILQPSSFEVCASMGSEIQLEMDYSDIYPHSSFKVDKDFLNKGFCAVCFELAPTSLPKEEEKIEIFYKLKIGEKEKVISLTSE